MKPSRHFQAASLRLVRTGHCRLLNGERRIWDGEHYWEGGRCRRLPTPAEPILTLIQHRRVTSGGKRPRPSRPADRVSLSSACVRRTGRPRREQRHHGQAASQSNVDARRRRGDRLGPNSRPGQGGLERRSDCARRQGRAGAPSKPLAPQALQQGLRLPITRVPDGLLCRSAISGSAGLTLFCSCGHRPSRFFCCSRNPNP